MATNILIGIGGTGAKVVESALMLFSAGLGPSEVYVGLIDQDGANGNGTRTARRVQAMAALHSRWQNGGTNHFAARPDDTDRAADILPLNGVRVRPLMEDGEVRWAPREDGATLESIFGQSLGRERRALLDTLFMNDMEEQKFPLTQGYRGRAHVGAAAMMAALLDDENPLIERLKQLMQGEGDQQEVRIFIAGSAFGGTGAAGFPTLSRELHAIRSDRRFNFRGQIGGLLMLPYFSFLNAPVDEGQVLPTVTKDVLMPKAQLAVEFYDQLFETEQTFDRFYTAGWDEFFSLGYHADGAKDQENPPLVPELVTATAIAQFFRDPRQQEEEGPVPIFVSSRAARPDRDIRWSDLPLANAQKRLGQLLRFCAYWAYTVKPALRSRRWWGGLHEKWLRVLGLPKVSDHLEDEEALDRFVTQTLEWAGGMERWSRGSWSPGLWTMGGYLDDDQPRLANGGTRLAATGRERGGELIYDSDGKLVERTPAHIFAELAAASPDLASGTHAGLGKAVAAAYRAARVGNDDN